MINLELDFPVNHSFWMSMEVRTSWITPLMVSSATVEGRIRYELLV
jgi:hypothetical protein